jgi:hypothetical protein
MSVINYGCDVMGHPISLTSEPLGSRTGDYLPAVYLRSYPQPLAHPGARQPALWPAVWMPDPSDDVSAEPLREDSSEGVLPYMIDLDGSKYSLPFYRAYRQALHIAAYEQAEKSLSPEKGSCCRIDVYV